MDTSPQSPRPDRDRDEAGRAENQRPRDRFGRPLERGAVVADAPLKREFGSLDEALLTGVALWNDERFFEAHEALEHVWHAAAPDDRDFWQGVIQVAVGCVHHQRGNHVGAATLLRRAADKLRRYPDVYCGIDVEQLRVFAEGAADAIDLAQSAVEVGYPEFPALEGGPTVDPDHAAWSP